MPTGRPVKGRWGDAGAVVIGMNSGHTICVIVQTQAHEEIRNILSEMFDHLPVTTRQASRLMARECKLGGVDVRYGPQGGTEIEIHMSGACVIFWEPRG